MSSYEEVKCFICGRTDNKSLYSLNEEGKVICFECSIKSEIENLEKDEGKSEVMI